MVSELAIEAHVSEMAAVEFMRNDDVNNEMPMTKDEIAGGRCVEAGRPYMPEPFTISNPTNPTGGPNVPARRCLQVCETTISGAPVAVRSSPPVSLRCSAANT